MSDPVSKIELAKALKAVQAVATPHQYNRVLAILSPDEKVAIERAIAGLSEEDEFALLCRLMGTATHLSPLEQRPIIQNQSIAPDFLARFHIGPPIDNPSVTRSNDLRCFVEVKSTDKDRMKIGGSNLRQRRAFADAFGLPLLIAVRFLRAGQHALWAIVHDSDRSLTSLTITVQNVIDGVRSLVWHEFGYILRPSLYFEATFDTAYTEPGVMHEAYGTQRQLRVVADHASVTYDGELSFFVSMLFECFDLLEVEATTTGTTTVQKLRPQTPQLFLADIVFRINRQLREESGELVNNAPKLLARLDAGADRYLVSRKFVENILNRYVMESFVFLGGIGDPTQQAQARHDLLST
jgi:hypothetical protein